MHLFAYGTLMFAPVWRRVILREFATAKATVSGFRVRRAAGELFPVMLAVDGSDSEPTDAAAAAHVPGMVYFDLDAAAWDLLDEYESSLYDRQEVVAELADGRRIACQAYVLPPHHAHHASDEPWTAEWFRLHGLKRYLRGW